MKQFLENALPICVSHTPLLSSLLVYPTEPSSCTASSSENLFLILWWGGVWWQCSWRVWNALQVLVNTRYIPGKQRNDKYFIFQGEVFLTPDVHHLSLFSLIVLLLSSFYDIFLTEARFSPEGRWFSRNFGCQDVSVPPQNTGVGFVLLFVVIFSTSSIRFLCFICGFGI